MVVRASRWPFRWNQITLAYATYFADYSRSFEAGDWKTCLTLFVGVHPPLYSLVFSGVQALDARPAAWILTSLAFSVATVPAVYGLGRTFLGRSGAAAAALLLALSPYHALYSLEVNDYPLFALVVTLCHWAFARSFLWRDGRPSWPWVLAATATVYTHFLGVAVVAAQGLALLLLHGDRLGRFLPAAAAAVALASPMLPTVLTSAGGEGYINAPTPVPAVLRAVVPALVTRFGPAWVLVPLVPLVLAGAAVAARERKGIGRYLLVHVGVYGGILLALLASGVASTAQFPYYLGVLPAVLLLAGAAVDGAARSRRTGAALAALGAVGAVAAGNVAFFVGTHARARAAVGAAGTTHRPVATLAGAWGERQAAFLIAPPTFGDDEKDRVDPAYAFLSPWRPHRFGTPPGLPEFVPVDPYWGNPFALPGGRTLYTFTQVDGERLRPLLDAHLRHGEDVWIALYDLPAAPMFRVEANEIARDYEVRDRRDWPEGTLLRVTGPMGGREP